MATVLQALKNPWISVPLAVLSAYLYPRFLVLCESTFM